jgi:molybdopterin-guanine dinucleotide biosynthesis protein A
VTRAPGAARCTGAILAGGPATRYAGRPKGLERVEGERIIDRVASALRAATDHLVLVGGDAAAAWLPGVRVVHDIRPGAGSLGGIHAAIVGTGTPVLVVAWDMPFVPAGLLSALRALGEQGFDAVVPESRSPRGLEPLCAYYTPACVSAIERRLDAGDQRVIGFYEDVHLARLDAATVARFGDPTRLFLNVNAPDDLIRANAPIAASPG